MQFVVSSLVSKRTIFVSSCPNLEYLIMSYIQYCFAICIPYSKGYGWVLGAHKETKRAGVGSHPYVLHKSPIKLLPLEDIFSMLLSSTWDNFGNQAQTSQPWGKRWTVILHYCCWVMRQSGERVGKSLPNARYFEPSCSYGPRWERAMLESGKNHRPVIVHSLF